MILVNAEKPRFFNERSPFVELDGNGKELGPVSQLRRGTIYRGGNYQELEEALGVTGNEILYVGDHIYADIVKSRREGVWRTALVVQEMEEILRITHLNLSKLDRLHELEEAARRLDDSINYHLTLLKSLARMEQLWGRLTGPENRVVEKARESARQEVEDKKTKLKRVLEESRALEEAVEQCFNPYWGELFRAGNEKSQFGAQVQSYAGIYTSRVSNFLGYSPNQVFRTTREAMPHELS